MATRKVTMLVSGLSLIVLFVFYEIYQTLRFKPNIVEFVDLYYFIGFGFILAFFKVACIIESKFGIYRKFFLSFLYIIISIILSTIVWFFFPHYLFKLFKDGSLASSEEKFFYYKLKEIVTSNKESGLLTELTNFEWDEFVAVTPYSPSEEASYLMFYKDKKLVKVINAYQKLFQREIVNDNSSFIEFSKDIKSGYDNEFKIKSEVFNYDSGYSSKIYRLSVKSNNKNN